MAYPTMALHDCFCSALGMYRRQTRDHRTEVFHVSSISIGLSAQAPRGGMGPSPVWHEISRAQGYTPRGKCHSGDPLPAIQYQGMSILRAIGDLDAQTNSTCVHGEAHTEISQAKIRFVKNPRSDPDQLTSINSREMDPYWLHRLRSTYLHL